MNPHTIRTIHALLWWDTLCGSLPQNQAKWPPGHRWTNINDLDIINCPVCKQIVEEMSRSEKIANDIYRRHSSQRQ